jgi:SAM-dependent methyltransferase
VSQPVVSPYPEALIERTTVGLHSHLIERLPSLQRNAAVLDVGCGTGAWLARLSQAGYSNLHGVDHDLSGFRQPDIPAQQVDLSVDIAPFGDRRFDLITAIEVIEHLENPGSIFRLAERHLTDAGCLLLTTPNIHSLISRLRHLVTGQLGQFDGKGDPTHITPVLLLGVERIAVRHGLRIDRRWGYPERGSLLYRRPLQLASRILGRVLPDDVPGDILCLLLRRSGTN